MMLVMFIVSPAAFAESEQDVQNGWRWQAVPELTSASLSAAH
ncbi:hypothetical protein [Methylobacterium oxalidis]|nr:hypothetical protein [Methylobacterium oxalidis]